MSASRYPSFSEVLAYSKERFPLPVYLLLCGGYSLSPHLAFTGEFSWAILLAALFGNLLFFYELRLMDERKDVEKDRIVNPTRPLARGLFSALQAERLILAIEALMLVYAGILAVAFNPWAGACYAFATVWLHLMYREFYVGEALAKRPFAYAVTHQFVLIPISLLGAALTVGQDAFQARGFILAVLMTASFFCYEICRKLDPYSHPLNRTYLQYHGPLKTAAAVALLNGIAVWASFRLGYEWICLPIQIVLYAALLLPIAKPSAYKLTELAATLGLVVHLWAPSVFWFWARNRPS